MPLPEYLAEVIQSETARFNRSLLARAARELTERYKGEATGPAITSDVHRAAYLAVRFPATYAVNEYVFGELKRLAPEATIASLLDLGAGPGTSSLAAGEVFPGINKLTHLESDQRWLEFGKRLAAAASQPVSKDSQWQRVDLRSGFPVQPHDVVVMSYALGELSGSNAEITLRQAWNSAGQFLLLIEPGTSVGFSGINRARSFLIATGAHLLAPCPHSLECPMAAAGDWCHFAQRVQRTAEHRQLKGGALGYEDEKFSYLIASRTALQPARARIVRHPRKHTGFLHLNLCTPEGLETRTVTKSQKSAYKPARHSEWGDPWDVE
jgi:ribosomal protein RSM22 (predicted rRNA methylase)